MRAELEQQQPERMQPFRQATARSITPCLATLVELCNNVIESKTANPHSKRRACLTNASACFNLKEQEAIETPALTDAFMGAIIRQLAHADKGRYRPQSTTPSKPSRPPAIPAPRNPASANTSWHSHSGNLCRTSLTSREHSSRASSESGPLPTLTVIGQKQQTSTS